MHEWILILTLHLAGQPGQVTDVAPTIVGGFTNEGRCQAAASEIAGRLIVLANKSRAEAGYQTNTSGTGTPSINSECVLILK